MNYELFKNPFNGRFELWIYNYHIHHSFIGLILSICAITAFLINERKWKSEKIRYISLVLFIIGLGLIIHWIIFVRPETNRMLWISYGE